DDGRNNPKRQRSADRRGEREGSGCQASGRNARYFARRKQNQRRGRPHAGATRERRHSLREDHRRSSGTRAAFYPSGRTTGRGGARESAARASSLIISRVTSELYGPVSPWN